ncbi:PTS system mannose/fructose/sorbose family transporter subunit IID [Streptococcus equi subsp. zooepidemicus]|nr:PTS system mannose/fructose/sorbose family transporter subunit IID [Streptococcus equi subsp. zooepidemicus]
MSGGILQDITKGASILGMFILAVLVQRWVSINLPSTFQASSFLRCLCCLPEGAVKGAELKSILGQAMGGMSLINSITNPSRQLDSLIPGLAGLLLTFLCMWLLKKKVSPIAIIIALFAFGIIAHLLHIM